MANELKNKVKIGIQLNNIGLTYFELKDYQKSLQNYTEALIIFDKINDSFNYSLVLGNLFFPHTQIGNYKEAKKCFDEAYELSLELGDMYGVAHQYGNMGELYLRMVNNRIIKKNDQNRLD